MTTSPPVADAATPRVEPELLTIGPRWNPAKISQAALDEARQAVADVLDQYPTLCLEGLGISNLHPERSLADKQAKLAESRTELSSAPEQVATAIAFLRRLTPTKRANTASYGLKHDAEDWGRDVGMAHYVSNGALITAALWLGLPIKFYGGERMEWLGRVTPHVNIGVSRQGERRTGDPCRVIGR